jgi:hypothetical protein
MADIGRSPHHLPWGESDDPVGITHPSPACHRDQKLTALVNMPVGPG